MTIIKTKIGRRAFIRNTSLAGGGLVLGFNWLASCSPSAEEARSLPKEWYKLNGFLKVGDNGIVTIMSPNPEIGQNIKTSMPMIVAEELDVAFKDVLVEQAPLNTDVFTRQLAGGSQSIRQGWPSLRLAGATARNMLIKAASQTWQVPENEITTSEGVLYHKSSGKSAGYGDMASIAANSEVPAEVALKEIKEFKIIGVSQKNVDGFNIVTGKPLYGIDIQRPGMLIAMIIHPPALGMRLKSFDATAARNMPGIKDIFEFETYTEGQSKTIFDTDAFNKLIAVVGNTTWECLNAKKAVQCEWEPAPDRSEKVGFFGQELEIKYPSGRANTADHKQILLEMGSKPGKVVRKDGDPENAFKKAHRIIERSYSCPFLSHNPMEPMNFFAHVTEDHADLVGPIQTPEFMELSVAERLGIPKESIEIMMSRQGGGFGRRLYGHFLVEAAVISQKLNVPIKLVYTREDDMTFGTYRPAYHALYRAALDKDNNLLGLHVRAGGLPESPLAANRFPAGAVDHYLAEEWAVDTNVTTGAFRAPRSNFIAGAEQSFLDELAEEIGKDPIEFRLELLERAKVKPVGENNDYDPDRYAGVLKLVRDKAAWGSKVQGTFRGVSAYFCHNSYVAQVLDLELRGNEPKVKKVTCAVDCGIVVNPDAASNMVEGATIDGIGHCMYSEMTLRDGQPEQSNFDKYRLIRHREAPEEIAVHFVKSDVDPTGLGEPPFPPIMAALANALYQATGKRHYHQPFISNSNELVG